MPVDSKHNLTTFPPYEDTTPPQVPHDSPFEFSFDSFDEPTRDGSKMASATSPFIKAEPNDFFDNNQFAQFNNGQNMNGQHMNNNVNPASLSNSMSQNYSSFSGNAGIADDELLDLHFESNQPQNNGFDFNQGMPNFLQAQSNTGMFSHTPDGAPIQSPFTNDFNYNQFRPVQGHSFTGGHSMPQPGSFRQGSHQLNGTRSPATPTLKVSDDFSHPGMQPIVHRQQNSLGNAGWDSTPSGHSWEGSPSMSSPPMGPHSYHPQISEVLKNNQYHKVGTSLPTKMEPGSAPSTVQEAKRRRRRESHNMVERRRRDNINERIHDLGTLVPQHRLEDEKVRKHLQTNAPLSPSITNATGISPPNPASSLLAGPAGRRATGITQGFPIDDKDKGPNKGDILNGSVAWTRDMMWYMHLKLSQEEQLKQILASFGKEWPFPPTEEEIRMRSELFEVINKHAPMGGFGGYSRAAGSGLRVPGFTNVAGDTISNGEGSSGQNSVPPISPGFQPGGSGMSSGNNANQFWSPPNDLKEEDEYDMELQ